MDEIKYHKLREERVRDTFRLDPVVAITLKGIEYKLEFNNWAIKEVLKDCDFNLMSKAFTIEQMEDPKIMGSMLFRGLQTNHPELTQEQVDKMFTFRHYGYVLSRLREAVALFMPDMSDVEQDKKGSDETQDPPKT